MNDSNGEIHRAVEEVARESYGRLVALLAARTRDVAGAQDALADALVAALVTWPRDGIPKSPQGWLLTAARCPAASYGAVEVRPVSTETDERVTGERDQW